MSHITPLKRAEGGHSFDVISRLCADKGWTLTERKTFRAYQANQECDWVINIPGCEYEIGLVRVADGGYEIRFDTWYRGGLAEHIGQDGLLFEDEYNIANTKMAAERYGHSWEECLSEDGLKQVVINLNENITSNW